MKTFLQKIGLEKKSKPINSKPIIPANNKSTTELVEEIHETFYTEVDRLLESAKNTNSLETDKQDLIEKCQRLQKLGFKNTKEITDASSEVARLKDAEKENTEKADLIECINYFSFKYPQYKFITEGSVKNICNKYGLIYAIISKYTGTVPDKNLKEIEDFKIHDEDACYKQFNKINGSLSRLHFSFENYMNYTNKVNSDMANLSSYIIDKRPLEIAAPASDFVLLDREEIKDFQIVQKEVPDPIVLQPIFWKSKKHYLIVSAWGEEASDETVVNHKMN